MNLPNNRIHPNTTSDFDETMSEDNVSLITYDRPDAKSAQELLYEAASELDQTKAETKWKAFEREVENDSLTNKEIRKLIQNLDEKKQWSALHYAVANNNYFVAKILIGGTFLHRHDPFKCNINILGGNGENALHVAAQSSKLWPSKNSDQPQEHSKSHNMVDHIVVKYSPSEQTIPTIVEMLTVRHWFENNIQINHEDEEGRTPLHLAVMANRHSLVSYLLDNNANLDATTKMNANVFHLIFIPSDPLQTKDELMDMVKLLRNEANVINKMHLLQSRTLDNRSPLVLAVCHPSCNEDIIKELMGKTNMNQFLLAFDLAAKRHIGNPKLLEPLLQCIDSYGKSRRNTLIQIACRHNHDEMLKWLIEKDNSDVNLNAKNDAGYTPLQTAVFYGAKKCVEYLLQKIDIDLKTQNNDGETLLHILAKRTDYPQREDGSELKDSPGLFEIIWTKIKDRVEKNDMIIKDNAGNTPLHSAACSNKLEICKRFLNVTDNKKDSLAVINEKNALGQTAAFLACEMGHEKIISYFWDATKPDRKGGLFKRDDDRQTCLHVAAAKNRLNIVKYLVKTVKMDVDIVADRRVIPLHLACQYGHSDIVTYLLDHKASPTLRDARLYNCLEIAIINRQDKLVENILFEHSLWRDMMRNAQPIKGTKAFDTPMRKLIRYMPQVTIHIIDKKLTRIAGGPGQKVHKCIYDYEFFQDDLTAEEWYRQGTVPDPSSNSFCDRYKKLSWTETIRCQFCCFFGTGPSTHNSGSKPYSDDSYTLVRNHPLFITAQQSSCPELIQHPFNICLRQKKFYMFGIYLLIASCLLYSTYLSIFTALVLQNKHPQYFYNLINVNYTEELATCEYVSKTLVNISNTEALRTDSHQTLRWVAFGFLILFIVKNTILIISLFPKLLRMGAYYLEVAVLVLSFVYIFDWFDWLRPVLLRCPVQYQIGSFALLLAWINFLTYVRYVPLARVGIYVVMLQVILLKFLQFLPVLMIIICGFGFTYWMLLQNQSAYKTPVEALIRTGLMIFDLGYEDRLYKESEGGIGYYKILYVMFILTGIVFSIFVANLMISLAVGELPSLDEQSVTWRHQMMYNLLSDYEILRIQLRHLIDFLTCGYLDKTERREPSILKFLRRRQDLVVRRDENEVFWLLRCRRYIQKHFFEERIHDNMNLPIKKKKKENEEGEQ